MRSRRDCCSAQWPIHFAILCLCTAESVRGELRYSIPEEMVKGSFVGNIEQDLGLDHKRLVAGRTRIVTRGSNQYFELNIQTGILVVKEKIDRESLCGQIPLCTLSFEIILENPIELHPVAVEILDINDNAPTFPVKEVKLEISESSLPGSRFLLESADDPDVGVNALQSYTLKPLDYFNLKLQNRADGSKYVEMVLQTPLDRENQEELSLVLTAADGGNPQKSGTLKINIVVLDANDNPPVFTQSLYRASVFEDAIKGTLVTTVTATDADKGSNGRVTYFLSRITDNALDLFQLEQNTGKITVAGSLDFEKTKHYEINVQAKDDGGLIDSSKVIIEVKDINDNIPVIDVMSFSGTVSENVEVGTTVAVINVEDADSGRNGQIQCAINQNVPFKIQSSLAKYYSIVTDSVLDRESISMYNITITARDQGSPPLSNTRVILLNISDVNDNAPIFEKNSYSAYVIENNTPGVSIISLTATDLDWNQNARVSYFIEDKLINGTSTAAFISINSDSGVVYAVRSFDYEQVNNFQVEIIARDGGSPPLSSSVTIAIIVQDQNDNTPQILYPVRNDGLLVAEIVPRSSDVGYLVTKVVAVDADSGQNAWLSYKLLKATDRALFEVGLQNGEIRTSRQVTDKDAVKQRLVVVVEDNGQPSRSATVNVNVAVADSFPEVLSEFTDFSQDKDYNDNLTFYLVLSLAVVSFIFIVSVILILAVKYYRWRQSRYFYESNVSLPVFPSAFYPPRYADVGATGTLQHVYNYEVCLTTDSRKNDPKCARPCSQNLLIVDPSSTETMEHERKDGTDPDIAQKPPNTDWRFSQGQRPGPSGAPQRPEEAGPWPNPPTEAEQLQALMAAANEVSEATNTLGASTLGPGTMGLSTRYSPQFTLQHVPDYRQNIYIPGSTATLTGNNPQAQTQAQVQVQALPQPQPAAVEAPKPAQTPANKKKSGKKEKK
ncbi:protocadherin gamma-A3-like isoform X3 [Lepisosteus oculatus]|uniref:protocadherin gamma-A3-like isoform X3 n=1 Tax=Lepisosteus oculatus TaxID=7918 RepID=UPI0035F50239